MYKNIEKQTVLNLKEDTKKVEKIKDDEFYMDDEDIDNDEEEKTKIIKYNEDDSSEE